MLLLTPLDQKLSLKFLKKSTFWSFCLEIDKNHNSSPNSNVDSGVDNQSIPGYEGFKRSVMTGAIHFLIAFVKINSF